jgi:hypothetical protein
MVPLQILSRRICGTDYFRLVSVYAQAGELGHVLRRTFGRIVRDKRHLFAELPAYLIPNSVSSGFGASVTRQCKWSTL